MNIAMNTDKIAFTYTRSLMLNQMVYSHRNQSYTVTTASASIIFYARSWRSAGKSFENHRNASLNWQKSIYQAIYRHILSSLVSLSCNYHGS